MNVATTEIKRPSTMMMVDQIRESHLLSSERMADLDAQMAARITPLYDSLGNKLANGVCADLSPYGRFLWQNVADTDGWSFRAMQRDIIAVLLTPEELLMIDKECLAATRADRDAHLFAAAQKVTEWGGGFFYGNTYFADVDALYDHLVCEFGDDEMEWPEYVWTAKRQQVIPSLDVADVVEHHVSDLGWEDMGIYDLNGTTELQAALDEFVEKNKDVVSYTENAKIAYLIPRSVVTPTSAPE